MEHINKLITFKLFNNPSKRSSFIKPILYFMMAIGLTLISDLYSGQLMEFIRDNRYAKHLIGFIILTILTLDMAQIKNPLTLIFYSSLLYFIFLMTTKMDLHWSIAIIILMIVGYIYESNVLLKENESLTDKTLKQEDIYKMNKLHDQVRTIIMISITFLIIIGTLSYFSKKNKQYGGNFDIDKFMFSSGVKHLKQ